MSFPAILSLVSMAVLIVGILGATIFLCVWNKKGEIEPSFEEIRPDPFCEDEPEDRIEEHDAKIIDMSCEITTRGIRIPLTVPKFNITFSLDDGRVIQFSVDEEAYLAAKKDMDVKLYLLDGNLYGYSPE